MSHKNKHHHAPIMVLLVDDQALIGEAVRRALANEPDIDFHFCAEGARAVEVAERIHPTVILQDLVMPDIDGIALVRKFRANAVTMATPIIVLSVKEDPNVKSKSFENGANDYLVKLPDRIELLARIRYHSHAYLNQLQKEEAMRALRESQQQLLDTNTALLSLNQKLEAATRAKSDFLAMMSHEIRTPLNAVLGFSDLLIETSLNTEQEDYVNTIRTSGNTLLTVINDVLDFSKIEAGKLDIEEEQVDVRKCMQEACDLFGPKARQNGTSISHHVSDSVPKIVCGDPTRIRQILTNLISNAVKFTHQGDIRVLAEVSTFEDLKSHGGADTLPSPETSFVFLRFCVEDTGPGIAKNKQADLFHAFQQVDPSMARKFGGTGLGLAICRRLSQLMGGEIWFEQPIEEGSRFVFIIRCQKAPMGKNSPHFIEQVSTEEEHMHLGELAQMKILIVEDNLVNAKLLLTLLKKFNASADHVTDGENAVEVFRARHPALIFMDIQMPKMNGLEATRLIREYEKLNALKPSYIIALTAEAMQGDDEKCLAAGMDNYLAKPLRFERMELALIQFLNKTHNLKD